MKIEVLGSGCAKCKTLENNVREAVKELAIEVEIVKVDDFAEIAKRGVMMTPALVVDGKVLFSGKVPDIDKLKRMLI
ncbi:MAG: TM0996/MTH895 family glutaredoxin-like protein [Thermoplasmata archaeon]|nr:TM0996/MTH895 family glutaredoxin-like protein [Thermoplasmata archaeon]